MHSYADFSFSPMEAEQKDPIIKLATLLSTSDPHPKEIHCLKHDLS
jgi:hypothetical protein